MNNYMEYAITGGPGVLLDYGTEERYSFREDWDFLRATFYHATQMNTVESLNDLTFLSRFPEDDSLATTGL